MSLLCLVVIQCVRTNRWFNMYFTLFRYLIFPVYYRFVLTLKGGQTDCGFRIMRSKSVVVSYLTKVHR